MRGVAAAGEEAGIVEHGGRGADRGEPATGGVLCEHKGADAWIGAEKGDAGAAGKKETIEVARNGEDGGKGGVSVERDAGAPGDVDALGQRGGDDLNTRAAKEVDGGDGFDFLKTGGEDCQNAGHGVKLARMSGAAHGNFSKERRLVIFGCGYVGAAVARVAVARGLKVTVLTRNAAKAEALRSDGVGDVIVDDLASDAWHERIEGGADYVLNCVSSGGGGIEGYRRSYLEGMASVVAWLRARGGAGAVIYTSSTSVYPQDGGVTVDENAPMGGDERAQVLIATERTLLEAEDAATARVVLRLAGIYGPGRHHLLEQVRAGEVAGRPDYHLNLAYRDDIAAAVRAAWGAGAGAHIFNVADDGAATKGEMVAWLAARIGVAAPVFSGAPAGGRRAVTPDRIIANAKLKAELGWRPGCPTFREGYEKILSL